MAENLRDRRVELLAAAISKVDYPYYYEDRERAAAILAELDAAVPSVCPFDCDSCHDEDCPCPRMGCAGEKL